MTDEHLELRALQGAVRRLIYYILGAALVAPVAGALVGLLLKAAAGLSGLGLPWGAALAAGWALCAAVFAADVRQRRQAHPGGLTVYRGGRDGRE